MAEQDAKDARIRELETELAHLEERLALNDEVDELAEVALRERLPLDHALRMLMPPLARATSARWVFVRTYDETLSLHDYVHAEGEDATLPFDAEALVRDTSASDAPFLCRELERAWVIAQTIDVAGEAFGTAAVVVPRSAGAPEGALRAERVAALLDTWCEEIDNHLAAIATSRKKAILGREISDALKDPVLDRGIDRAIAVLRENLRFESLLVVFRQEDEGDALRAKFVRGASEGEARGSGVEPAIEPAIAPDELRRVAQRIVSGDDDALRELLGVTRYREELLITGARSAKVVGRVVASSRRGEFNTFDRDLLERFADSLRQRIVDFNREWRNLKTTFESSVVDRLLGVEGYRESLLTPREHTCAVLFADISGFTRLSEQVLVRPERIGHFIDFWSAEVVRAIWETGGVFDKMVGDCVIAIYGPPFFELTPKGACERALEAATRIRAYTRSLSRDPDFPELEAIEQLEVSIGLNLCPLFVGVFGPDQDYTGFSSGMNNTARLQGQAKGGEILCMDTFVEAIGDAARFGEERQAAVKNVREPLRFRALRDPT